MRQLEVEVFVKHSLVLLMVCMVQLFELHEAEQVLVEKSMKSVELLQLRHLLEYCPEHNAQLEWHCWQIPMESLKKPP
jgi:Co/Zn/Cd efflux system component